MPLVVTAAERASFARCRQQWDFSAAVRQNLEPASTLPDLDRAVRDALAVYYFPGMWDWDRAVRFPLVSQELERALTRQRQRAEKADKQEEQPWQQALDHGQALLAAYLDWAPAADRFAPVLVETDFEVDVLDPRKPDAALLTGAGELIRYRGRVDLLAIDEHDAYWIVRHRVVDADWQDADGPPAGQPDEESLAACWAWEQFYLGMAIAGTIYNEIRSQPGTQRRWLHRKAKPVRQHEPSGGGRSIPQHRRMYAQAREPRRVTALKQVTTKNVRRTWLRHDPATVQQAAQRLIVDLAEMTRDDLDVYPEPSDRNCPPCPYLAPCLTFRQGGDAEDVIKTRYRHRPAAAPEEGRLGGRAWAMGRGAAPPKFRPRQTDIP
jgi:hypothetical protein